MYKNKVGFIRLSVFILAAAAVIALTTSLALAGVPRNVILMIPDGCSAEQYTLARWFKGAPLVQDQMLVGMVKTYIADSVVADSAPTASAYATGLRTSDKHISVGPQAKTISSEPVPPYELQYKPLATVLEGAKLLGKAVGVVSTSRMTHATPAAFVSHVPSRSMEDDIMEQAVYQNLDLAFGGGKRHLLSKSAGGKRPDGENLVEALTLRGYKFIETRDELVKLGAGKVFGLFNDSHMEPDIDRAQFGPREPTLSEMTAKAIELLSRSKNGFFLMVEGSQVDWACHANDPAYLMSELMAYDKAVAVALDFARRDGETLLISVSDHNTGGMSIGNYKTSQTYPQMSLESLVEPLKKMKLTAYGIWRKIGKEPTVEKIRAAVKEHWGLNVTDVDAGEILTLGKTYKNNAHYALSEILSARYTNVGWATHGHSGGDVPMFAFGPGRPAGLLEGFQVAKVMAAALGLDLNQATSRLFVEAAGEFGGGKVKVDLTDKANPVVKIEHKGRTAELPANKNLLKLDGQTVELEGVVVYAFKTGKAYLPMQAVNLIRGVKNPLPGVKN